MSTPTMYYRTLGNTGIVSSVFGFGFWATFGVKSGLLEREGIDAAKNILTVARQGGINLLYVRIISNQSTFWLKRHDPSKHNSRTNTLLYRLMFRQK